MKKQYKLIFAILFGFNVLLAVVGIMKYYFAIILSMAYLLGCRVLFEYFDPWVGILAIAIGIGFIVNYISQKINNLKK